MEKVNNQNLLVLLHTYTFITNMEGNVYIFYIYIYTHTHRYALDRHFALLSVGMCTYKTKLLYIVKNLGVSNRGNVVRVVKRQQMVL